MCFHSKQTADATKLKNRFKASLINSESEFQSNVYNGFTHPKTPVITNENPDLIQLFEWGLIPSWANDKKIQDVTLNARIETITEKPSFKGSLNQKCLILLDGFYEWKWLDSKGKEKQKYLISLPDNEPFAVAGLWSMWINDVNEQLFSYTMITAEARGIMREIHNTKLRMPVILTEGNERSWLMGKTKADIVPNLVATLVG